MILSTASLLLLLFVMATLLSSRGNNVPYQFLHVGTSTSQGKYKNTFSAFLMLGGYLTGCNPQFILNLYTPCRPSVDLNSGFHNLFGSSIYII